MIDPPKEAVATANSADPPAIMVTRRSANSIIPISNSSRFENIMGRLYRWRVGVSRLEMVVAKVSFSKEKLTAFVMYDRFSSEYRYYFAIAIGEKQ